MTLLFIANLDFAWGERGSGGGSTATGLLTLLGAGG